MLAATKAAFWLFLAFYVVCAAVVWRVYLSGGGANDRRYAGV